MIENQNSESNSTVDSVRNSGALEELSEMSTPATEVKAYEKKVLENGLEVYLVKKSEVPIVTLMIAVRNGAFVETPDIDGLAHLYEHMFFKANEKIPSQREFIDRLDELGVELGAHANATTSTEVVRYFLSVQSELLGEALEFMADAIQSPLFLQDELEKERKVVLSEFDRFESSPQQVFFTEGIIKRLFTPYFSHKDIIGNRDVINAATPEQMRFMKDTYYVPNNTALILVGDYDENTIMSDVQKYYESWSSSQNPFSIKPAPEHPPIDGSDFFNQKAAVTTSSSTLAFQGPSLTKDNQSVLALELVQDLLGFESSPFRQELVDSGIASSAYFYIWTQRYTSPIFFAVEAEPEKIQEATKKLQDLVGRMLKGGFFTQENLDIAKTNIRVQSAYSNETGSSYANTLASYWSSMGEPDFFINYPDLIEEISLQDIDRALQKYVRLDRMIAGALGPEGSADVQFVGQSTAEQ